MLPVLLLIGGVYPVLERIPEWLGDDLIDEGQLDAQLLLLLLGYLRFPENECAILVLALLMLLFLMSRFPL